MILQKIVENRMGENTYVVGDENTKKCFVVDPGASFIDIMNYVKKMNLIVEYIVLTHGHGDHITSVLNLKEKTNAKIVAHEAEKEIVMDKKKNLSASLPSATVEFDADMYVKDNDTLKVGDLKLKFIHTPGHTPGSMCIKVDNKHMLTGDTLFAGSMGRTDFYGGDSGKMEKSLKRLKNQDDDIIIYPGHGPNSTLKIEKTTNPFMR
ncbi:MAG: MBL fold metallo-hydrolase [Clostridium sp.]